ncbi:MAG TPA: DUF5682 family protein, partial [Rugosimonospora sp.]|nr:DUF5682 family protein [Rugosimonospora sp.]
MTGPVLLGVRHHGPGSARAVRRVLMAYQPEIVLIEGPPEADPLVPLAGDEQMRAPVALLAYPAGSREAGPDADPRARRGLPATFWPFAEFSPEWQAIRWAVAHDVPVRFVDLPAAVLLAGGRQRSPAVRTDPIGALAAAAGYDDAERWWEDVVEHRHEAGGGDDELAAALRPFGAIAEAMAEVRAHAEAEPDDAAREAA